MSTNEYNFKSLTPNSNANTDIYNHAFEYVFKNKEIRNVAISGSYGCGKSSVLATYKKNTDKTFIHISLSHFQSENDNKLDTSILEGKIINQLLHQIPLENIPQTNFKVKKTINPKLIIIKTLQLYIYILSIIFFGQYDNFKNFVFSLPHSNIKSILIFFTHTSILILSFLIILIISYIYLYNLVKCQINKNIFRKFKFKNSEVEIFNDNNDSYFSKYLNEVLYLFKNSNADVIVFEDIDRFNSKLIFEHLREINTLINTNFSSNENNKYIRFFYLLRDDIFTSKERTKFFDFIIPIIPVINNSNSYEQLLNFLKNNKSIKYEKFDDYFLKGLCLYIDDMRLLKNIYNEFMIYFKKINITELDYNKMLSIVTYKNLFPEDFSKLQFAEGYVYSIFNDKTNLIKDDEKNKKLKELITDENISTVFKYNDYDFSEIIDNKYFNLLKFLIRNGYIDENYNDYITYFYENSMNRIDKIFLTSLYDKTPKDPTYKLENPKIVISYLNLQHFDQKEILNYSLFTFLLNNQNKDSYNEYLNLIINQLKLSENFNFIGDYLNTIPDISNCVKFLNKEWSEFFYTIYTRQAFSKTQIKKYSINSIYYCDNNTIELMNKKNCLCNYISNSKDYLEIKDPKIDILIDKFKLLDVKFTDFEYKILNKELFMEIYNESLYEINEKNISLICEKILKIKNKDCIIHKNYTEILNSNSTIITKYINDNISVYLKSILKLSNNSIKDSEDAIISILNNTDLEFEEKIDYISALKTTIINIDSIEDIKLYPILLDKNVANYSQTNILHYYNTLGFNKPLILFINKDCAELNFVCCKKIPEYKDIVEDFMFDLSKCDSIENTKYKEILTNFNYELSNFDDLNISDEKITILIDNHIIKLTQSSLEFLRYNYDSCIVYNFIKNNIKEYIKIMSKELFSEEELFFVLDLDTDENSKKDLLEFYDGKVSLKNKNYSNKIFSHILNNNFDKSELPYLFESYEKYEKEIRKEIFKYAIENTTIITDNVDSISKNLIRRLLFDNDIATQYRISLLISTMKELSEKSTISLFKNLNLKKFINYFINKKPNTLFENTEENLKILKALKESNKIKDIKTTDKGNYKIVQ